MRTNVYPKNGQMVRHHSHGKNHYQPKLNSYFVFGIPDFEPKIPVDGKIARPGFITSLPTASTVLIPKLARKHVKTQIHQNVPFVRVFVSVNVGLILE